MTFDDRRHPATPRQLREARRRGEAPQSRELAAGLALLASLATAAALSAPLLEAVLELARSQFQLAGSRTDALEVDRQAVWRVVRAATPLLAALLAAAWAGSGLQTGMLWAPARLRLDWQRLHWGANARRIGAAAPDAAWGWLKSLAALSAAVWVFHSELPALLAISGLPPGMIAVGCGSLLVRAAAKLGLALVGVGVLDYLWQRRRHRRRLRMTDPQLRQSQRDDAPSPQVASRRRRRHREASRG